MPTNSFRMKTANRVAKRALEKLIAVASASGRCTMAVKPVVMAIIETTQRVTCILGRFVRKAFGKSRAITGISKMNTNICLKNKISNTGNLCPTNLIPVIITVAHNPPINSQTDPRAFLERPCHIAVRA